MDTTLRNRSLITDTLGSGLFKDTALCCVTGVYLADGAHRTYIPHHTAKLSTAKRAVQLDVESCWRFGVLNHLTIFLEIKRSLCLSSFGNRDPIGVLSRPIAILSKNLTECLSRLERLGMNTCGPSEQVQRTTQTFNFTFFKQLSRFLGSQASDRVTFSIKHIGSKCRRRRSSSWCCTRGLLSGPS